MDVGNVISVSSLNVTPFNDYEADPEEVALLNKCRLLFIQAGADPTLCHDEKLSEYSFVGLMLSSGVRVLIRSL